MVDETIKRIIVKLTVQGIEQQDEFVRRVELMKEAIINFSRATKAPLEEVKLRLESLFSQNIAEWDEKFSLPFKRAVVSVKQDMIEMQKSLSVLKEQEGFAGISESLDDLVIGSKLAERGILSMAEATNQSFELVGKVFKTSKLFDPETINQALKNIRETNKQTEDKIRLDKKETSQYLRRLWKLDVAEFKARKAEEVRLEKEAESKKQQENNATSQYLRRVWNLQRQEFKSLMDHVRSGTKTFGQLEKAIGRALTPFERSMVIAELEKMDQKAQSAFSSYNKLGRIFTGVFTGMIAFRVFQFFTQIIGYFSEATEKAIDFRKELIRFYGDINALQRTGFDTTLNEWNELISKLGDEFTQFTERDIRKGVDEILILGRQVGLSNEQMKDMARQAAALATVIGVTMTEATDSMTDSIKSGKTSGQLRELVGSMKKTTLNAEAVARGFAESASEVDEYTRALTLLSILQDEYAQRSEAVGDVQDDVSGKITEVKNDISDLADKIGNYFLPIKLLWQQSILVTLTLLNKWLIATNNLRTALYTGLISPFLFLIGVLKVLNGEMTFDYLITEFGNSIQKLYEEIQQVSERPKGKNSLIGNTIDQTADDANELLLVIEDTLQKLEDDWEDYSNKLSDIETDSERDLEQIVRKGNDRRHELAVDLSNDLERIARKTADKVADANRNHQQKLVNLQQEFNNKETEINEKYHTDEINTEEKFQEKLRTLREEFLFDLEDAVRARDARQILRLIRRYSLDKTQLERQTGLEKKERDRRHKEELNDNRQQMQQKQSDLQVEHQRTLLEIKLQAQRERREAQISNQQAVEELRRSLEAQRRERLIQAEQQRQELTAQFMQRLSDVIDEMSREAEATGRGGKAIYDALKAHLGPGGSVEGIYKYYISLLQNLVKATDGVFEKRYAPGTPHTKFPTFNPVKGYAEGGTLVARKPTLAMFGETPEVVTFSPISRFGRDEGKIFGGRLPGSVGERRSDRMALEIFLSPELESRIVENTLGEFSDILVSVERAR